MNQGASRVWALYSVTSPTPSCRSRNLHSIVPVMVRLNSVVMDSSLACELREQAFSEGLLEGELGPDRSIGRSDLRQQTLALLLLFDEVHIINRDGDARIPLLEESGVLYSHEGSEPIPELSDRDERIATLLVQTEDVRPFILNALLQVRLKVPDYLAETTGHTRRTIYNILIGYLQAYFASDKDGLAHAEAVIDREILTLIIEDLLRELDAPCFTHPGEKNGLGMTLLLLYSIYAGEIEDLLRLSTQRGATIATHKYAGPLSPWAEVSERIATSDSPVGLPFVLRVALREKGKWFPRIESIKHALAVREHPALQGFRSRLEAFCAALERGKDGDTSTAGVDLHRTARNLREVSKNRIPMEWDICLSVPAATAQQLPELSRAVSAGLSIFSMTDPIAAKASPRQHKWMLFEV